MTNEVLKRGVTIQNAIEKIDELKNLIKAENFSVTATTTVSLAYVDKQTRQELINVWNDVLDARKEMLTMELEEL